jgi:small subunit ribosomal protein S17e
VRPEKVKRVARELFERYPSKFTVDFEQNKKVLKTMVSTPSKSLRNTIAGYITRLVIISQPEETLEMESSENEILANG